VGTVQGGTVGPALFYNTQSTVVKSNSGLSESYYYFCVGSARLRREC
jgi:hypothetical protein